MVTSALSGPLVTRHRVLTFLTCLLCLVVSPLVATAGEAIRFAPEKDYGPFVYVDDRNEVRGLSVDMLAAISLAAGIEVVTLPARSLSEILAMAERGEVDLISSLRPTPERARFLNFSSPYVSVPAVLLTRSDNSKASTLDALKGKAVAVGKGYAVEAFARERFPDVRWTPVADDVAAIQALQTGKVDGVVADIASIGFVIRQHKLSGLKVQNSIGFEYSLSFGYSKLRPDIGEALERGLRSVRAIDRDNVTRKWLDAGSVRAPHVSREVIQYVALGLLVAGLLLLVWLRLRNRVIKAATE